MILVLLFHVYMNISSFPYNIEMETKDENQEEYVCTNNRRKWKEGSGKNASMPHPPKSKKTTTRFHI